MISYCLIVALCQYCNVAFNPGYADTSLARSEGLNLTHLFVFFSLIYIFILENACEVTSIITDTVIVINILYRPISQ